MSHKPRPSARRAAALLALVLLALAAMPACKDDKATSGHAAAAAGPKGVVVQFRPVASKEPADCKPLSFTPPLNQTLDVLYQGQCLHLELPEMVLSKAAVKVADDGVDGALRTTIELDKADARTMAEVSTKYQGRRIAMVAFGKVLVAPQMQAPIVDGKIVVTGLTKADAARLQAALK
jgi:preprotein translocase subunit SecD